LVAPNVFEIGDDDLLHVRTPEPATDELPRVDVAVRRCPKGALALEKT
jgi:ferredoxin